MACGLLLVACGTTYQPRHTGRVGLVIHHGAALYVKDGQEVAVGPFNGQLEALVAESPGAAGHARRAHSQFLIGVPSYLTGAAGVVVGVVVLSGPVGWVVIATGAAAMGTGLVFMGSGLTHAVDAVNVHNDEIPEHQPAP